MAEWFAVPCRALAGIAIIARDNSHNRNFTCGLSHTILLPKWWSAAANKDYRQCHDHRGRTCLSLPRLIPTVRRRSRKQNPALDAGSRSVRADRIAALDELERLSARNVVFKYVPKHVTSSG
jgi:hypothetical protein